jgi:flagellar capping protein FliD
MIDDIQDTFSERMDRIDHRIEVLEARLSVRETQLRQEFSSMQQTLNLIIAQQAMVQNILTSFMGTG